MKKLKKYYSSCEFLPLWNFFKLNNGESSSLKYLVVLKDRLEYEGLEVTEKEQAALQQTWHNIFEEYNKLEKNFGAVNFLNDKAKIVYYYTLYLQEQAVLNSLLYKTNVGYIRLLRERGYKIKNTSQKDYWQSLSDGLKRVEQHISYIKILQNKIKDVSTDSKKDGNPYDDLMAWIASNGIDVKEDITVTRFIKIKEIILKRQKAKQQQQTKSRLHGQ